MIDFDLSACYNTLIRYCTSSTTLLFIMPPQIDLDLYQSEIIRRITAGETQTQVREWLNSTHGVSISKNVFSKRIVE